MPDKTLAIPGSQAGGAVFARSPDKLRLLRLCGMATAAGGGPGVIQADGRRYDGDAFTLEAAQETGRAIEASWRVGDCGLKLASVWRACPETGVVSRRDTLTNAGKAPVVVSRCLARMAFPPGRYECYAQTSRWCRENQGSWQPLHAGIVLGHVPGRTTEGNTPYLVLRSLDTGQGVVCHLLPCGNWTIRVRPVPVGGDLPLAVVELGLADEGLHRVLAPGESLALPEVLFQPLPEGEPHLAAPTLHRYLIEDRFAGAKPEAPVVYNTWFDQFEILDVPRLRKQLAAAKETGCEVFVIDAGWYGAGDANWAAQTGNWREKTKAAFHGRMREFADEVRSAGLGFGLWMEPERFGPEAPIRTEHPEWFVPVGGAARINLTDPAAYAWLRAEIGRLVETYGLAWMKIDFNFSLDADASGAELYDYYVAWRRMLDEIRAAYPRTFFEGCASGALRADLAMLSCVDGHFLSDSVNPTDMLRISQGAYLRLPPGRLTRWAVLRAAGRVLPRYGRRVPESPPVLLTPRGALWEPAETVDLDFALLAALPGMFGLSGDLAGLSPEHRERIAEAVTFYKKWRRFITGSTAHLLTPPRPISDREGWIAFQFQPPGDDASLVFVYRLGWAGAPPPLRLRGLDPARRYGIACGFAETETDIHLTGKTLMHDGLSVPDMPPPDAPGNSAQVFVLRATFPAAEITPNQDGEKNA